MAGEPGVNQMEGAKEIEAPNFLGAPFPTSGRGQVGNTREEYMRGTPLKMQLSGGA